jgi:hypothetical protein
MAYATEAVDPSTKGWSQSTVEGLVDAVEVADHLTVGEDHFDGATNVKVSSKAIAQGEGRLGAENEPSSSEEGGTNVELSF